MTQSAKAKRLFCILSALSGILGVLMLIVSFSINAGLPPGSSGAELARFAEQHNKPVSWGAWLQAVGPVFVVLFPFALVHLSGAERRLAGWMTFFGATVLMTVNLIKVTFYMVALFTSPNGMTEVGIRFIESAQHLYFIVSAPAFFLPLGTVLVRSRIIPRVTGYLAFALGATFALVGMLSLLTLALPASITSLGSIQACGRLFSTIRQSKDLGPWSFGGEITMLAKISITLCCLLALQAGSNDVHQTIHVAIDGLHSDKGQVICSIYSSAEGFPKDGRKAMARAKSLIANQHADCAFPAILPGAYAISVFHDENSNGRLDTNFLGILKT